MEIFFLTYESVEICTAVHICRFEVEYTQIKNVKITMKLLVLQLYSKRHQLSQTGKNSDIYTLYVQFVK